MPPISYPLINGHRYDFTSLEFFVDTTLFFGLKAFNFSDSLEAGEVRGNAAQVLGQTRGKYSAEGSMELPLLEFDSLTTQLTAKGLGYMEQPFTVKAAYSEVGSPVITVECVGCRIKKADHSNSEGNEGTIVKCDLSMLYLIKNGKLPIAAKNFRR